MAAIIAILMPVLIGVTALALDAGLLFVSAGKRSRPPRQSRWLPRIACIKIRQTQAAHRRPRRRWQRSSVSRARLSVFPPSPVYSRASRAMFRFRSRPARPGFSGAVWGSGNMSVSASATARSGGTTPYSSSSVILLDPSSSGSLTVVGGSNIVSSAPIQVNSSSMTAVNVNNGANINAPLNIVGNKSVAAGSSINGAVNIGVSSVPDPLASLPVPSIPSPTSTPLSSYQGWGAFTMQPGLYTGNVNLGNGGTFTMQPGTYYIQGGNFNVANGVTLSGSGVTIYIDNTNVPGTSSPGSISFQGGTTSNLSAPSSGTYSGLLYFQNRNSTTSPQFGNGATINMKGTFYAAGAPLTFNGGTSTNQLSNQMVVKSMNISNGATVNVPYSSSSVASAAGSFALVQ